MSRVYESAWWSVELPSGWLGSDDDGRVTFIDVGGTGALTISAYRPNGQEVTDQDLEEFSQRNPEEIYSLQKVSYGSFVGIETCERTVTRYWRKYWLRAGSTLLFVTYNCKSVDEGVEDREVDQILHSLALNESAPRCQGWLN